MHGLAVHHCSLGSLASHSCPPCLSSFASYKDNCRWIQNRPPIQDSFLLRALTAKHCICKDPVFLKESHILRARIRSWTHLYGASIQPTTPHCHSAFLILTTLGGKKKVANTFPCHARLPPIPATTSWVLLLQCSALLPIGLIFLSL